MQVKGNKKIAVFAFGDSFMYHSLKEKKKKIYWSSLAYLPGKTEKRASLDTTSNLRVEPHSGPLTANEHKGQFFSQTIAALDYNSVLRREKWVQCDSGSPQCEEAAMTSAALLLLN